MNLDNGIVLIRQWPINSSPPSAAYMCRRIGSALHGSDNGLSPGQHQALIWTSADILLITPQGAYFNEILFEIQIFSFKGAYFIEILFKIQISSFRKMCLNMSFAKWRPFCSEGDDLIKPMVSKINDLKWYPWITIVKISHDNFTDHLWLRACIGNKNGGVT